jgi:hypothetical protein
MSYGDGRPISEYLVFDDEALLEELGDLLLGLGPGFGPPDIERRVQFAKSWLDKRTAELRRDLCGDVRFKLEHEGGFDLLNDAAVLAEVIETTLHGRPLANLVAVILLRRGLGALCNEHT